MSIISEMNAALGSAQEQTRAHMKQDGLVLGKVSNINDPDKKGRVKCTLLSENKKVTETDWCSVMTPWGGKNYGQFFFPNVDDLVVLGYLDGETERPFVLGSFWNQSTPAPYQIENGKNIQASVKTPGGTEICISDEKGKESVTVTLPSGTKLVIDDEKKAVTVSDKDGENQLNMDLQGGTVQLKAKTKLELSAGQTTITLESSGKITEKASSQWSIEAASVKGKATGQLAMEGAEATVKATGQLTLQATGMTALKGGMVKIN